MLSCPTFALNKWPVLFFALLLSWSLPLVAEVEWEPDLYPKMNIFPSLVIGTATVSEEEDIFAGWDGEHVGDAQGLVGATISGLKKGDKIKLVVAANEFMKESKYEGVVKKTSSEDLLVHPKITYFYDRLANVTQAMPLEVSMELFVNGESVGEKSSTVTVRSVNDCLFGVAEDEDANSDYSWLFSAYVNEGHPWVDRVLKEALETGIVSSFDGYQAGEHDDVVLQIFAIWNVMQRRGMKYSDITTTAAERDGVYSQHVRLFDQALSASQANCVDGSVLLAAVLRKIGLYPYLVIIPGHMFLAVDLDDDTTIGIETTMMGMKSDGKMSKKKFPVFKRLSAKLEGEAWQSFEGAVASGTETLQENMEKFESDDLEYQVIDLAEARRIGILPIRYKGGGRNMEKDDE